MKRLAAILSADPRHAQILALAGLVALGAWRFGFEMPAWRPGVALATALAVQWAVARAIARPFDPRSAAVTALSLTMLLRTDAAWPVAIAAALAIGSKAVLRVDGRHIANPAALGLGLTVLLVDGAWVAPGQWGTAGWLVVFAAGAGAAVTHGARRLEVPLLYLAAWAALAFARAAWLGDPPAIPLHQMSSGALVVFAFFMISDPMTAPRDRRARALWVCLAAAAGFALQHLWIVDAGPVFGLLAVCWLTPLLDRLTAAPAPDWRRLATATTGDRPCRDRPC